VAANGAWAALGAAICPANAAGWPLLVGALAAAQADTWATEIGAFSARPTRLLTTGAVVAPGTSGGVTPRGTIGGAAGAAAMGILGISVGVPVSTALAACGGGLVGYLADSLLGATVQARYRCDACRAETETALHACGGAARQIKGWHWIDNDVVNFWATGGGGITALAIWLWL
jgi:uncharacterized protein (TIGR00297 family)